jgi:hypothetical protein
VLQAQAVQAAEAAVFLLLEVAAVLPQDFQVLTVALAVQVAVVVVAVLINLQTAAQAAMAAYLFTTRR